MKHSEAFSYILTDPIAKDRKLQSKQEKEYDSENPGIPSLSLTPAITAEQAVNSLYNLLKVSYYAAEATADPYLIFPTETGIATAKFAKSKL